MAPDRRRSVHEWLPDGYPNPSKRPDSCVERLVRDFLFT